MNIVRILHPPLVRLAVAMLVTYICAACGLNEQAGPDVLAPSEFGVSLSLSASPDILTQDGLSQTVITAVVRDERNQPVPNLTILWRGTASTSRVLPVRLSASSSVTDASGLARVVLSSPDMATESPAVPDSITVSATPVRAGFDDFASPRFITVTLRPVTATGQTPGQRNNLPEPAVSVTPAAPVVGQEVTFDASRSTDEGEVCLDRCAYAWNFGDGRTATGRIVRHTYTEENLDVTVTLTVTDERGGAASTTVDIEVPTIAVPIARFTVQTSDPVAGSPVVFDARASTAASGTVIRTYTWNFGDGAPVSTGSPTIDHTYTEGRNPYHVTLTVTDSNGRTSQVTARDVVVRD